MKMAALPAFLFLLAGIRAASASSFGGHLALASGVSYRSPNAGFGAGAGLDLRLPRGFSVGIEAATLIHAAGEPNFTVEPVTVPSFSGLLFFTSRFSMTTYLVRAEFDRGGARHGGAYGEIGGGVARLLWNQKVIGSTAPGIYFGPDTTVLRPQAEVRAPAAMVGFGWRSSSKGGPLRLEAGARALLAAKRMRGRTRTWYQIPVHLGIAF
jgi:hypothetical protein